MNSRDELIDLLLYRLYDVNDTQESICEDARLNGLCLACKEYVARCECDRCAKCKRLCLFCVCCCEKCEQQLGDCVCRSGDQDDKKAKEPESTDAKS